MKNIFKIIKKLACLSTLNSQLSTLNSLKGQALLIVILVMTIALTVALSVATRTITIIRTSAEEENSERAFSAAEAGIEKALQDNAGSSGTITDSTYEATYTTSIATLAGQELLLNNGITILKDNPADLWFSTYPDYTNPWTGTLTIYWGGENEKCDRNELTNTMAALEVILIVGTKASPQLTTYALDPCGDRQAVNKFELISPDGGTVEGKEFAYKKTLSIASGLLMRIIPLYANTNVAVKSTSGNDFPAQGTLITSIGVSDNVERKLVGFKENPSLPVQIFPFMIFSPK